MSNILWNGRVILLAVVVAIIPLFLSVVFTKPKQTEVSFPRPEQQLFPMATEIFGVKIEKNPPESRLNELYLLLFTASSFFAFFFSSSLLGL
jgi:hypothetical protein